MNETLIALCIVIVVLIAFDICMAVERGPEYTISAQTWAISKKYPIIPFALGGVAGHLFWSQC